MNDEGKKEQSVTNLLNQLVSLADLSKIRSHLVGHPPQPLPGPGLVLVMQILLGHST